MRKRLLLCSALLYLRAFADITIDLTSTSLLDTSSTAVWNLSNATLHLPFIVDRNHSGGGETEDDSVLIGNGSDGAFSPATYATFDVNNGTIANTVTLDTSRIYQFTSFTLAAGDTLTGSDDSPLRIRVQGDVLIAGTIDLSGTDGEAPNASLAVTPQGGSTCCGGGAGGAGGSTANVAADGLSADVGDTGKGLKGAVSTNPGSRSGGGGGGGFEAVLTGATAGLTDGAGGAGGAAGGEYSDPFLTTFVGGSGGGGGAKYDLGASDGSGGGGGAGGGALSIHAGGNILIDDNGGAPDGAILATGGNGGDHVGGVLAGGGGGGAGGAILLFAGGTFTNNGSILATGGAGAPAATTNGDGSAGRTRFVNSGYPWVGTGSEDPLPNMPGSVGNSFGQVFYTKTASFIMTKTIDTANSSPQFTGIDATDNTPTGTSITYQIAGSSDNFQSDNTGFVDVSQLAVASGKRYIKFRAILSTTDRTVTPSISAVTIRFNEHVQNKFLFGSEMGCAGTAGHTGTPVPNALSILFLFFIPWLTRRIPSLMKFRR